MYQAEQDPYCYPQSLVLKNKAGLTTQEELDEFEAAMTFARSEEPLPDGDLSAKHYRAIHHHLFQDVFDWAGEYRTVRIAKEDSVFCYPENIEPEMARVFSSLREQSFLQDKNARDFASGAAHFLTELNAIHPFREGNGRTQLTFLKILASHSDFLLNLEDLNPAATLDAMIASYRGDERPLAMLIASRLSQ